MKLQVAVAVLMLLFAAAMHGQTPGSPDVTFGTNGHTFADLSAQNTDDERATKVLLQADGKRVVVVDRYPYIQLIRFNADGSYDNTFGEGGFSQAAPFNHFGGPNSNAAIQSDGKIVATGETEWNSTTYTDFGVARWNTDGTLDATFGTQGIVTTNFGYWEEGNVVQIQPDGKILVAGETSINSITYLAFARYNSDGTLDGTFGSGGKHVNPIFGGVGLADMKLTPGGKIMVLGDDFGGGSDFVLARFLSTGPIDVSFTTDGYEEYDWGGTYRPYFECMEIQADGKILLGGSIYNGVNPDMLIARYNADGTPDYTFHGDGKQTTHIGGSETIEDLAIQTDGKIVAAGRVYYSALPTVFALARYETDGDLDGTFGVQGTQITSFSGYDGATAVAVVLHPDGDITAAGTAWKNYADDVALATYDVQGTLTVDGYPVQRITAYYADDGNTTLLASAVQADGKLVAAGYAWNGRDYDFLIARFNMDGTLDQSFGTGGYRRTDFSSRYLGLGSDYAYALAIQQDGKIVVTGSLTASIAPDSIPVARYNTDGSLDGSFGAGGLALVGSSGAFHEGNAVLIQPDGKIIVGGSALYGDFDFVLCRLNTDGTRDGSFGTGGVVITNFGYQDIVRGLVLQPNGKLLATGNTSLPNSFDGFDFCTVRYNSDGGMDTGFGTNGRVTTDFDGGIDFAQSIALQSDGKIVVGGGGPVGNDFQFGIARYDSLGVPDASFGTSGKQTTGFIGYDIGDAVSLQSDGKILLAGFTEGTGGNTAPVDIALARYGANGTLDAEFGSSGKVTADFNGQERGFAMNLFKRRIYVSGVKRIFRPFTATDKYVGIVATYVTGPPPPDEQITNEIDTVNNLPGVPVGSKQSLNAKLMAALSSLAAGDTMGACNNLRAFINEVNAQKGKKKLTAAQADKLIADATTIMTALGCSLPKTSEAKNEIPVVFALDQNYPNPFNPTTTIHYALPQDGRVTLEVYDVLGRRVVELVNGQMEAGYHAVEFNAASLASGLYVYRMTADGVDGQRFTQNRKLMLLK